MIAADTSANSRLSLATIDVEAVHAVARPKVVATSEQSIIARISEILTAPNREHEPLKLCRCAPCRKIRNRAFICHLCGFSGEAIVQPCECRDTRASNIAFCERKIAAGEEVQYYRRCLAEDLGKPDKMCVARVTGGACGHGLQCCPTCLAFTTTTAADVDSEMLLEIVRAIRGTLSATLPPRDGTRIMDAEIVGILNRPLEPTRATCDCSACVTLRETPFCCRQCGFDHQPDVPACECPEHNARRLRSLRRELSAFDRGDRHATLMWQPGSSREEQRGRYVAAIEVGVARQDAARHAAGDEECDSGHARWRTCPVCVATETSEGEQEEPGFCATEGGTHAAAMIRDLRAALHSRGIV